MLTQHHSYNPLYFSNIGFQNVRIKITREILIPAFDPFLVLHVLKKAFYCLVEMDYLY